MSDQVQIALIAAIPGCIIGIIGAIGTVWVKINQSRMKTIVDSTAEKVDSTAATVNTHDEKLDGIHHEINSMKEAQIADARTIGHSEGVAQELAREKADPSPPKA